MSWSTTLKNRQLIRAQVEAGEAIAVMFSDIRGFSSFTAERGDAAAFRLTQVHENLIKERIESHSGIIIKRLGDGIMAAFAEPVGGLCAAAEIQQAIREWNLDTANDPIDIGIGLAGGTPIMTETDLIGHSVNLAQRLSSEAKGRQILVTDAIRSSTRLPEHLHYLRAGRRSLKGLGLEEVYEVTWMAEAARLSNRDDHLTLILTEGGTLVIELAKELGQELDRDPRRLPAATKGRSFSAFLGRLIRRTTRRWIDLSLGVFGVSRESSVDRVALHLAGSDLIVQAGDEKIWVRGVDRDAAQAFLARFDEVRADIGRRSAS